MSRKVTPIWPDTSLAEKQTNLRMRVEGELQRRNGFASSNVAKQSTAVLALVPIGAASGPGVIVMPTGGSVFGYTDPSARWLDVAMQPPTGQVVPGGCTATQTFTLNFTWSSSIVPSNNDQAIVIAAPGSGCCYDVVFTVTNNLTNAGSGTSTYAVFSLFSNPGFVGQQLFSDCAGTLGNFVSASGPPTSAVPVSVTGIISTSHWLSLSCIVDGGTDNPGGFNAWTGTSTVTLTITPNHACSGC